MSSRVLKNILAIIWLLLFSVALALGKRYESGNSHAKVLGLGTANAWTNWTAVGSHGKEDWSFHHADLDGFGDIMHTESFQAAIDYFGPKIRLAIKRLNPAAILVVSKGLNVFTHVVRKEIYKGPAVLLSPIPNECTHIPGQTWEEQWSHSMDVLKTETEGPIGIGVGTSADEQTLIVEIMNETRVCGNVEPAKDDGMVLFESCPELFLRSYPGDHGWKNNPANAMSIATLIDEVLTRAEQGREQGTAHKEAAAREL